MLNKKMPDNELGGLAPALGLKHPKGYKKPKLDIDIMVTCTGMEKNYGEEHVWAAFAHGKKNPRARLPGPQAFCCYEPTYMFKAAFGEASLPYLGLRFEKGKTYKIIVKEV